MERIRVARTSRYPMYLLGHENGDRIANVPAGVIRFYHEIMIHFEAIQQELERLYFEGEVRQDANSGKD